MVEEQNGEEEEEEEEEEANGACAWWVRANQHEAHVLRGKLDIIDRSTAVHQVSLLHLQEEEEVVFTGQVALGLSIPSGFHCLTASYQQLHKGKREPRR